MGTEHKCQWCGQEFEPTCHKSRQKFCGAECRKEWWREYHKASPSRKPGMRDSGPA